MKLGRLILAGIALWLSAACALAQYGPIIGPRPVPVPSIAKPSLLGTGNSSASATTTITTTAPIAAGNLVCVGIGSNSTGSITVSTVSDGTNSYSNYAVLNADSFLDSELWCKTRAAAVPLGATITVTYSGAPTGGGAVAAIAVQVAGLNSGAVDKTASASGTSTTVTASTAALSQVNEILFGVASQNGTTSYTSAAGFTTIGTALHGASTITVLDYEIVSSTAAVAYSPTFPGSAFITAIVASIRG